MSVWIENLLLADNFQP